MVNSDVRAVIAEKGTKIEAPQVECPDVVVDGMRFSTFQLTGWMGENGYVWDGTATPIDSWDSTLELWPQWETTDCLLEAAREGPVEFTTAAQLAQLAKNVEAGEDYAGCQFILTRDVTLTGGWRTPIGSYDNNLPFSGEFRGENGARIILDGALYPLFGYLGEDAQVSNITVTGTATQIESNSGGLVIWNGGSVSNITAENLTLGHVYTERVGGIVGWNLPTGVVEDCTLSGSAISGRAVGGIVSTNGGTVRNCETDGASSVETGGNVEAYVGNTDYNSGYCLVLGAGGIVGTNIRGTVEDCQNSALINANGTYSVAGGVVGICRDAIGGGYVSVEKTVVWGEQGFLRNCTNLGSIQVSAEYPIVGGVLGMYSDINAPFTADTISGVANTADIQVKNTGSDTGMRNYAAVGGVIGKLRAIPCLDWDTREVAAITGLTHSGSISAENCNSVGGILGGSYNCYVILRDCVARGSITSKDTDYAGGIFGCGEFLTADPISFMFDGDHGEILIDRCTAELDIRTEGTVKFAGGVAASREEREKVDNIYAYFDPITIIDSGHFGALTAPEGTWDGVCPVNRDITRSWHGSGTDALVVTSSASESGRHELSAGAMTSGEAAWLLDGGEDSPLGIWTQGGRHPVLGRPVLRRVRVQSGENGSLTVNGASAAYAAVGSALQVSAQPSREIVEKDGVKYRYILESVTLTWTDGEGNIRETDVTDTMSLAVPDENASLTARFTLEELPPGEEPEEQPDIGTGNGTGGGTGNGSGSGVDGTGTGDTGTGTGTGENPDPSSGAGSTTPETPEEPGDAGTDALPAEETSDVPQAPEEPNVEIPDDVPPQSGMDVTGSNPAVNPIDPAGAGAAGGQGETPPIYELIPAPLREPHVAAVVLGLLVLLAAGVLWQSRKYRRDL